MPSLTRRDSFMEVGEGDRGGSRGGCTQISPAPFLSTPHSCPIAQERKPRSGGGSWPRLEHGESEFERRPSPWALLSGTLVCVFRNTWDSGCWTGCRGTNLHPGFAAHTSSLNSHSSVKLPVQCHLRREASATPGGPGGSTQEGFSIWMCHSVSGSHRGVCWMSHCEHHSIPFRRFVIQKDNVQAYLSRTFCQPFLLSNLEPEGLV